MPPQGGRRTSLVTYNWGQPGQLSGGQDRVAPFAPAFEVGGLFSPGQPLVPPDAQRTRVFDFPVGVNFIYTPRAYEPIDFETLRALADNHDITRLAIETRKDQIEKLNWKIRPKDPNNANANADTERRQKHWGRFWSKPDGVRPFATWLRACLEDLLVLDAPAFEMRRNRGGELIGLDVVDGATIKVLVDDTGRIPSPPAPAYEQVIHGRPWRLLTTQELLYTPRNVRPHKLYGFGPVEQIVTMVNIGLRRENMQLRHFTDGNVPAGLINAPDGWNAEQIRQFQEWFDSILSGNDAERMKLVWGPSGAKYQAFKEPPYKDQFDEWVARVVCYAFSLPPTPFIDRAPNRSSSETLQEAALEEGLAPLSGWVERLCTEVMEREGDGDLEFTYANEETTSPLAQMQIITGYVNAGLKTRNEGRAMLGDPPAAGGDDLIITTGAGNVRVSDIGTLQPLTELQGSGIHAPRDERSGGGREFAAADPGKSAGHRY